MEIDESAEQDPEYLKQALEAMDPAAGESEDTDESKSKTDSKGTKKK